MHTDEHGCKTKTEDFSGCKAISFTRCSIAQKSSGIWTVQTDLQQIYPKSDRLLESVDCDGILPDGFDAMSEAELRSFERTSRRFEKFLRKE
jgi:hypothetical protein